MADSGSMTRSKEFPSQIQHDIANRIFFIKLGTSKAFLSYTKFDKLLVLEHTEVPAKYAGQGLGKLLAKVRFQVVFKNFVHLLLTLITHFLLCSLPLITVLKMIIKCN